VTTRSQSNSAEALEGPLGQDYLQFVPDWVKQLGPNGIFELYPTIDEARDFLKLDWGYINTVINDWIAYWKELTASP